MIARSALVLCVLRFCCRDRPVDAVPSIDLTAGDFALCSMDVSRVSVKSKNERCEKNRKGFSC